MQNRDLLKMAESKIRSQVLETRLEVRDVQLQLAIEAADLGVWTWEPATGDFSWSKRSQALLAADVDTPADLNSFLSRIHPQDQVRVKRALNSALQMKTGFSVEFRVALADDAVRRISCVGRTHASLLHKTQPAVSGVLRDVTADAAGAEGLSSQYRTLSRRSESLRVLERNALADRLSSEISPNLSRVSSALGKLSKSQDVSPKVSAALDEIALLASAGLESARAALFEMQPPGVAELGFGGAIERYANEAVAGTALKVSLSLPKGAIRVRADALNALYAAAQTGIDNVVRHARARTLQIAVTLDKNNLCLIITDDGVGMAEEVAIRGGMYGLLSTSERLNDQGGKLRVVGSPTRGTTFEATVPVKSVAIEPVGRSGQSDPAMLRFPPTKRASAQ
jgi:signal transduction histidine kinase